jgi:diguanylate cyclase
MTGGPVRAARDPRAPLLLYVIVQLSLTATALLVGGQTGSILNLIVEASGLAALGYGVNRRRPRPAAAWWSLLAGVMLLVVSGITIGLQHDFEPRDITAGPLPTAISTVGQLLIVLGLALLSWGLPRRGPADVLDAVMSALAVYLVLWTLFIAPAVRDDVFPVWVAVLLPIGSLLIFTTAMRLVLGGGLRDPAVALIIVAAFGLLLTFGIVVVLGLRTGSLRLSEPLGALGSLYFTAFGAAGLQPALGRHRIGVTTQGEATGWPRTLLFAVLALIPPVVWGVELAQHRPAGVRLLTLWLPVLVSAVFLLLLVLRLAMMTRLAQRRADELGRRTSALARSMSEQQELQRQLSYRAQHDPLTGLANRTVLAERMERVLDDPRDQRQHALLLLDLDHFKDINDTLGHPVGDELLISVARRLRDLSPPGATLVRLGGDEFAAFLEDTDVEQALAMGERFRADLRRVYHIGGRDLFVTTSIGVLVTPRHPDRPSPSDLLRDADLALYAAKSAGKDRVELFHPALRTDRLNHARISAGLRHALANDDFVLYYQPIIEVDTGAVVAVEALLRWRAEDGRLVPPADFIPVAEATGMIDALGTWALRRALRDGARWFDECDVAVAVNVSGRQFAEPDFAASVLGLLREYGLPGRALIVEITESSLVGAFHTTARSHLQRLRDHGVRIAIDDFGTGYSSLSYVAQLPVDIVKIDKSFTQSLAAPTAADPDWAFTQAILQLVASLDKVAVAEGVETAEQAAALQALHCPLVQGFHYSQPVPADVIDRMLARSTTFARPAG